MGEYVVLCCGSVEQARCEHISQTNIKPVNYCSISVDPVMCTKDTRHRGGSNIELITKGSSTREILVSLVRTTQDK